MRSRSRRSREVDAEINITAFMNLMVVLIPFLLLTAVFSQVSILELNLPPAAGESDDPNKKPIVLEVLIYSDRIEVVDRQTGPLKIINNIAKTKNRLNNYDFITLTTTLIAVKGKFPKITDITILLEDNTPYDLLIKTMDTVRLYEEKVQGITSQYELFPEIAIGNAPPDNAPIDSSKATTAIDASTQQVSIKEASA